MISSGNMLSQMTDEFLWSVTEIYCTCFFSYSYYFPTLIIVFINQTLAAVSNLQGSTSNGQQRRNLSIHEHMSMELLKDAGIAVPRFTVASSTADVLKDANELGKPHNLLNIYY